MKRRYRPLLNVCSLALLACSLYLNFVHKETAGTSGSSQSFKPAPTAEGEKNQSKIFIGKEQIQAIAVRK